MVQIIPCSSLRLWTFDIYVRGDVGGERNCFERSTMTMAVNSDDRVNITALAASTAPLAEETPVSSETATKTFNGTRKSEDSCGRFGLSMQNQYTM